MDPANEIECTDTDAPEEAGVEAAKAHHTTGIHRAVSVLDSQDDPFAPREGKTLAWKNVNMTLVRLYFLMELESKPFISSVVGSTDVPFPSLLIDTNR